MRFLLFTLYAPLASFGEIAVGVRRMGWPRPGRSAVLGLVAAARGIERADEDAHRALEEGLGYAVRTDAPGRPFVDYHTIQMPVARKGRSFATRREELNMEAGELGTVVSFREWRSDAFFTVALWIRNGDPTILDSIAAALRSPKFMLYLGRKSAPLGLPPHPAIVEVDTLEGAFGARQQTAEEDRVLSCLDPLSDPEIAFDADAGRFSSSTQARIVTRRDSIAHRGRWQFVDRSEAIVLESASRGDPVK